jgi:hypothetical protein
LKWRKLGRVWAPAGDLWWARTHAFIPTPLLLDDRIRVYVTTLDERQYGRVAFVDLDRRDPMTVIGSAAEPLLDLGSLGAFDEAGVNASSVVRNGAEEWLYYIGWQRGTRVPHLLFAGLAKRTGDGRFERVSRVPVLDRTDQEPFSRSAPFVTKTAEGFRAWYWSCREWIEESGAVLYSSVIKHAVSGDGITWSTVNPTCIAPEDPDYAVGRPWVVQEGGRYRMWYSIRSRSLPYRLGYAESLDGISWSRKDDAVGLTRSESGWDSEMVCFPAVLDVDGRRLLFYNGNRHGLTGFGLAELEQDV